MRERQPAARATCERAHSFQMMLCGEPGCGIHVVSHRSDGTAICETVFGPEAVQTLAQIIRDEGLDL